MALVQGSVSTGCTGYHSRAKENQANWKLPVGLILSVNGRTVCLLALDLKTHCAKI